MRLRLAAAFGVLLALMFIGSGAGAAQGQVPPPPTDAELVAGSDSSITIAWAASPGATSYNIYRGTSSGLEDSTPIVNTTNTLYKDPNLSPQPVYFYQLTAVNAAGESARTPEDASRTPPPVGTGGNVAGVASGNGMVYYARDALLDGFDWFQTLNGWFPQVLGSSGSISPGQLVTDMAYSSRGTMTFNNVVVPTSGLYTVDWRYAFESGLFPGVTNRQMGLRVDGEIITRTQRFIITGSFDVYQHSPLQVQLNAGVNSISQFAVSNHGVPRVDQMVITPATASVPSGPTNLTATATQCPSGVALSWTPSVGGNPTSYSVYRGTISDGENVAPIGTTTGATISFTDTDVRSGTTYFYAVAANNSVGVSPNSNEASVTFRCSTPTSTPAPTNTPTSTSTPSPTNTPASTSTPAPTNTPVNAYATIQAESFTSKAARPRPETTTDTGGGLNIGYIRSTDWLGYNTVDFGVAPATKFLARVASAAATGTTGVVEVHLDTVSSPLVGSFVISNTGGYQSWVTMTADITPTTGTHAVYLVFNSASTGHFVNINWFVFAH